MSQVSDFGFPIPLPPEIATSFQTQNGTAIPDANILIVNGVDSEENNANGIITKGGVVGTGTANEVDVVITNRIQGTTTTTGVQTLPIISFTPTDIGTYSIECRIASFNETTPLGAGYSLFGTIRYDGIDSYLCGTPDKIINEEGAMTLCNANLVAQGLGGGSIVTITGTGYALQTINWSAVGLYTFIGVI